MMKRLMAPSSISLPSSPVKKSGRSRKRAMSHSPVTFAQRLALNRFMMSLFKFKTFDDISSMLRNQEHEGISKNNHIWFYDILSNSLKDGLSIDKRQFSEYDDNIRNHSACISKKRSQPLVWEYFQYLSLLFTEIFLDRYFCDAEKFCKELNHFLNHSEPVHDPRNRLSEDTGEQSEEISDNAEYGAMGFNARLPHGEKLSPYKVDDLRKLAFWSATGSGKTLLMHMNIHQYRHYMNKYKRPEREINKIILLTPNEGLSHQHRREFNLSNMKADLFSRQGGTLFSSQTIDILEISRLRESHGDKTVSVDSFEDNNLVLIDEGHLGSGGNTWREMRKRLSSRGFAFEYSATFSQAIKATGASRQRELTDEYAKSILFDYSYSRFHRDGYGKDYRILNLQDDRDEDIRRLYLTACLLTYFQQLMVYRSHHSELTRFYLAKPLWVFVGGKVTAVRKEKNREVSDVVDILLFISDFVTKKADNVRFLDRLLKGSAGLLDNRGQEIFDRTFSLLKKEMKTDDPDSLYHDILSSLFNGSSESILHLEELKGMDGEIALRLGENPPFGVINVGDSSALLKLCQHNGLAICEKNFGESLFRSIDDPLSQIHILIGSKKFSSGWNSWRVSTMGLMNVGRSEGSEIIQLFGRGVRLKGYDLCLKRHRHLESVDALSDNKRLSPYLDCLETLNVFGLRADYMKQFQEYLAEEGQTDKERREEIQLPVRVKKPLPENLQTIHLKRGRNYRREQTLLLDLPTKENSSYLQIIHDCYPELQIQSSIEVKGGMAITKKSQFLTEDHLAFLDYDRLYVEIMQYKVQRGWFNLYVDRDKLCQLFESNTKNNIWYTLYINPDDMSIQWFSQYDRFCDLALDLLKKYCERFYKWHRAKWESDYLEYRNISEEDPNFIPHYTLSIDQSDQDLIDSIKELQSSIASGSIKDSTDLVIPCDPHLYLPLLYKDRDDMQISPIPLNAGEKQFVDDLQSHYKGHSAWFEEKKIYLLRNMSRGRGVGFFAAGNFHPDFILWIFHDQKQYIAFMDPKGLRNLEGQHDPKIEFYKKIKDTQALLADQDTILNSFILSVTPQEQVQWKGEWTQADFNNHHIFFQNQKDYLQSIFNKILQESNA